MQVTMPGTIMPLRSAMIRIFIVLGFIFCSWAYASAQASEAMTEARVFEVERGRLQELGIPPRGVSAEMLTSDFIINIPESSAKALASGKGSRLLQSFQLT